jgi:2-polyprenyl-3-methyl-5-hydroxy-6-metoxy-1,4-benzoquinol methylase
VTIRAAEPLQADPTLEAVPDCLLCGREGSVRYRDLRDCTFEAPGCWNYRYCEHCQLLWLAERPLPTDMGRYYATYYTHAELEQGHYKRNFKKALMARELRSDALCPGSGWRLAAAVLRNLPPFSESALMGTMMLGGCTPGRLLDVGCGNGDFLATMQQAGWEVAGIEPDPRAAEVSSKRLGIIVPTVSLRATCLPPASYDAITLQHVIEHVYDPIEVMQECRRILKPTGHIVIVTPNIRSLGHSRFADNWRGLEPPRHLHLFSADALRECAQRAGLSAKVLRSSARMARGIWLESQAIIDKNNGCSSSVSTWKAALFQAYEQIFRGAQKEWGEELVLDAAPRVPSIAPA